MSALLSRSPSASTWTVRRLLRGLVLSVDWLLRRYYGVREFAPAGENLLRISMSVAGHCTILADGTAVRPGDQIIDLHLWNEHIPALGPVRMGLGWGSRAKRRIESSLSALAASVEADPALRRCKAIRGEAIFLAGGRSSTLSCIAERLGFEMPTMSRPADPGHTLLSVALAWASHVGPMRPRQLRAARHTFWMSRRQLRERYLRRVDTIAPPVSRVSPCGKEAGCASHDS